MHQVGLELTIPMFEWAKTVHTSDRAATVIGEFSFLKFRHQRPDEKSRKGNISLLWLMSNSLIKNLTPAAKNATDASVADFTPERL
jgi:hypothetical protein